MKRGMLFLLVISMLFLAGCAYILGARDRFAGQQPEVPRGIGLSIVDNFPSLGIQEGTDAHVQVKVINYNAKDTDVNVRLKDSVHESQGGIGSDVVDSRSMIGSGTEERPKGFDEETITFGPFEYSGISSGQTVTFTAEASFDYDYESTAEVCIDGFNARPKKCGNEIRLAGAGLGLDAMRSPVAVTLVKASPYASEDGVTLPMEITIANIGNGLLKNDMVENIHVDIRGFDVRCNKREIKFTEEIRDRTISCTGKGDVEEGNSLRPLLAISYKYTYKTIVDSRSVKLIIEER